MSFQYLTRLEQFGV